MLCLLNAMAVHMYSSQSNLVDRGIVDQILRSEQRQGELMLHVSFPCSADTKLYVLANISVDAQSAERHEHKYSRYSTVPILYKVRVGLQRYGTCTSTDLGSWKVQQA